MCNGTEGRQGTCPQKTGPGSPLLPRILRNLWGCAGRFRRRPHMVKSLLKKSFAEPFCRTLGAKPSFEISDLANSAPKRFLETKRICSCNSWLWDKPFLLKSNFRISVPGVFRELFGWWSEAPEAFQAQIRDVPGCVSADLCGNSDSRGRMSAGHMAGQMGHVHGTDGTHTHTHTRGWPAKILYVYCFCSFPISVDFSKKELRESDRKFRNSSEPKMCHK